jgi:hypothetical protein
MYSGVPISSLRAAVKRGEVPAPTTGSDGTIFDAQALDTLRESPAAVVTAPVTNSEPGTAAEGSPPAVSASFLVAAVAARDAVVAGGDQSEQNANDDLRDEEADNRSRTPTHAALGSTMASGWPYSCAAIAVQPAVAQARVADLEREVAELRSELAANLFAIEAAMTETTYWKSMHRGLRLQQVGDVIANELTQQRVRPAEIVQYAAHAAVAAVAALPDAAQLAHPGVVDVGRHAAAWVIASWLASVPAQNAETDLDRARERRAERRHRGGRW